MMPPILKALLPVVVVTVAVVIIAFRLHVLLGIGLIAGIIGWSVYANRAIIYATQRIWPSHAVKNRLRWS